MVWLAVAFPAAAPAARDRCAVKGSRTLGGSEHLRVYGKGGRVHVCERASGERGRFDNPPNKVRIDDVGGWRIAYVEHDPLYSFQGSEFDSIRVYDATSGKGWDLLDTSPAIELGSLAVNRRYVYWTRSGVAQRAAWNG